jgi:hypothetical protein
VDFPNLNKEKREEFLENYLRWDGILILRIISQNTNDIIMSNLVGALWRIHSNARKKEYHSDEQIQLNGHYMRIDSSSI